MVALKNEILDEWGKPYRLSQAAPSQEIINLRQHIYRVLKARYDAAQDTGQNQLHWINADLRSPNAANELPIRKKLRSRSRYETANNGYLLGIQLSLANDLTGSGPSLQITDPRLTKEQKQRIERRWGQHKKKTKLRKKLWRLRFAKSQDGEGFAVRFYDRRTSFTHPAKTNWRVFECDQVSHYNYASIFSKSKDRTREIDGIRFYATSGEPEAYYLLNDHPGETFLTSLRPLEGSWIPEENVIHWFRQDRSWLRGIPETTSTLPLWALIRRYTLAVVQNAEIAADFTVLLKTMQPVAQNSFLTNVGNPSTVSPEDWFEDFPVSRGMMTTLPNMYDLEQLKPTQPVSVYDEFVNALVQEAARPLLVPKNIALGSSGDFNMASANFDRQLYRESIRLERLSAEEDVLEKDLNSWWFEAIRIPDYFEDDLESDSVSLVVDRFSSLREDPPEHVFRWDEVPEHVDPTKVAMAMQVMHTCGFISDKDVQEGRFNRNVEDHYKNLEEQTEARDRLGLPPVAGQIQFNLADLDDDSDEEGGNKTGTNGNRVPSRNGNA